MARRRSLSEIRAQLEADRADFGSEVYARRLSEATAIARQRSRRVNAEVKGIESWLSKVLVHNSARSKEKASLLSRFRRRRSVQSPAATANDRVSTALRSLPTADGLACDVTVQQEQSSSLFVIDYRLPALDVIPHATSYKVDKATAELVAVARSKTDRNRLYQLLVAQVTLGCLHAITSALDTHDATGDGTIVFNGFVESVDVASGHLTQACLISVRVTARQVSALNLENVDPVACLRSLHAALSPRPSELVAVQPIMRLDMTDSRFVNEEDVLSALETRPNLLDLTPGEFESLITNLFTCMGLETRLTQPSRDGGVDCVAFDTRPVLGGKVVVQAKRYANTVGVGAVRDLYGTVLNEGAAKGILVTTSGFGPAAFEFAAGKPLELLSGANLLALLQQWAGIDARIVPPAPPVEHDGDDFIPTSSTAS